MILGVHPWGVDGLGGGERVHPTHMHMHAHAHACVYDIIGNSQGFPQMGATICIKLPCLPRMHACACVWGKPQPPSTHPQPPSTHPQELQEAKNTKIQ